VRYFRSSRNGAAVSHLLAGVAALFLIVTLLAMPSAGSPSQHLSATPTGAVLADQIDWWGCNVSQTLPE
jgi:hypothetical protein